VCLSACSAIKSATTNGRLGTPSSGRLNIAIQEIRDCRAIVLHRVSCPYGSYRWLARCLARMWNCSTVSKVVLARELPNREEIRRAIEQSPDAVSTRVRLTIARTPELCMVMQEHISGDWLYQFKAKRAYLGKNWQSSETEIIYRDRRGIKVTVMPVRERKDSAIYDGVLTLPFVSMIYGVVFLAGTNPFTHLEVRCSQPPVWHLERTTPSQVWLKQSIHGSVGYPSRRVGDGI
jgi:hypothetical protein